MLLPLRKNGSAQYRKTEPVRLSVVKSPALPGVLRKPESCARCPLSYVSTGFCGDALPSPAPKLAFLFAYPTSDEVTANKPFAGRMGEFFKRFLLEDHGRTEADVLTAHVLRCQPPRAKGKIEYPSGYLKRAAEASCRAYDGQHQEGPSLLPGGLLTWKPNIFLCSMEPQKALEVEAFKFLIRRDVAKAWRFADQGYRPCVLFGNEPRELVGEFLKGGAKDWRGHWWEVDGWPFSGNVAEVRENAFERR